MARKKVIRIESEEEWRRWVKKLIDSAKKEIIIIEGR